MPIILQASFEKVLKEYLLSPSIKTFKHSIDRFLVSEIPSLIKTSASISDAYKIEGSVGSGNRSEVPWIGVFDREITETAQKGYYIVYLFNAKMSGVYLSLNQGWTYYEKLTDNKDLRREMAETTATFYRDLINSKLKQFPLFEIDLSAKGSLGEGYETAHICGKYYPANQVPEDSKLITDLMDAVNLYKYLKEQIPKKKKQKSFTIKDKQTLEESAKDATLQHEIQEAKAEEPPAGPQPLPIPSLGKGSVRWEAKPGIAKGCCEKAKYTCEADATHGTFISRVTNKGYVEAHHLIPISKQGDFPYDIDVPENILILCPLCHRKFHHANNDYKNPLLEKFFHLRKDALKNERGIEISLEKLYQYYG